MRQYRPIHPSHGRFAGGFAIPTCNPLFSFWYISGNKLCKGWGCMDRVGIVVHRVTMYFMAQDSLPSTIQFRKHITSNADWRKWTYTIYKLLLCVCLCLCVFRPNFQERKDEGERKYETNGITFSYFQNRISKQKCFKTGPSQRGDSAHKKCKVFCLQDVTPCCLVDVYRNFRSNCCP